MTPEWVRPPAHAARFVTFASPVPAPFSVAPRLPGLKLGRVTHALNSETAPPLVGVIMGSRSDWETMSHAARTLDELGIPYETRVVSAHRTPDLLFEYASSAEARGLEVIIAGAGGAAHLPGMTAAKTVVPVLGVPVESKTLRGVDSLLSIVQMPAGVPVATFAIGRAGAVNAALFAAAIVSARHPRFRDALHAHRRRQTDAVLASPDPSVPEAPLA